MPYEIKKVGDKFRLYNLHKKEFVKKSFNSKSTAQSAGMNYMRYRKERPYIKGNKILAKK